MNTNNIPYNQPPQGQMPPQGPMMPPPPPNQPGQTPLERRRMMAQNDVRNASKGVVAFPKWLSTYPIVTYILALMVVSFMYSQFNLPWYYMLSGTLAVVIFFLFGSSALHSTSIEKISKGFRFERRIFLIALIPRVLLTVLIYWIFMENYGDAFGFENMDTTYYDELGTVISGLIERGNFHFSDEITKWSGNDDFADMGYGVYVGFIYWLTGNSIIAVRLLKCIWSTLTVILIYRLTKRNFGERSARVAAIFCALWPNFWYYCTCHLKETEMVFLTVLYVEQADQMLRSRQFTAWKIIPILLIVVAIFAFRTPLGIVALLSLVFSVVMSSTKVVSWGKRIVIGGLAIVIVGVIAGNQLEEKARGLIENQASQQEDGINWYANRKDASGNQQSFAKYAGAAVFAPMIFTLPFPSMVRPFEGQDQQQLQNGGNFAKNIISGFTILALIMLLMTGRWREHLLPLSFVLGYLAVLAFSSFAHSERFHQPTMPLEFMFAAYGLSIVVTKKKYKRWFTYWCVLMLVGTIAWNWFKMAGRGLA